MEILILEKALSTIKVLFTISCIVNSLILLLVIHAWITNKTQEIK